jgi:peptidoglycan/xylan/chitin deacetylase (PgdA/CDA1 family)
MSNKLNSNHCGIRCRFLFNTGPAEELLHEFFLEDVRAARLSPSFRAYYRLRSFIPLAVRQLLQRYRRVTPSPNWYLPLEFANSLAAVCKQAGDAGIPAIHPWPDGAKFAFVPTHDVETSEGMRRIEKIANIEEDSGFRSSWNIVPHKYPVDRGLIRDLQSRGFEIGVHGYNHDGKLFTSHSVFNRRVAPINAALNKFDAVGFRAPMVHRNFEWLQSLDIEYDASYFDIDPYQAMPGGIGSVWPFMAGRFVELPYTLPQDHTLFIALGERDGRIWEEKLEFVAGLSGLALVITHPDYLDSESRVNAYQGLLETARATPGMWHALPSQVAGWWRDRDQSTLHLNQNCEWNIKGPAAHRGRAAALRICAESCQAAPSMASADLESRCPVPKLAWHDLPSAVQPIRSRDVFIA